jgi:hypothetical protein
MLLNTSHRSIPGDVDDLNIREHNTNINTRNYLLSKSSLPLLPMSYNDLRSVITDQIPSNIVILPKALSSCQTLTKKSTSKRRHSEHKKNPKQTSFDVYRSLARSVSHYPVVCERDTSNDHMTFLANSFTTYRISLLPNNSPIHAHNLSKPQKYDNVNSNDKQRSNRKIITNHKPLPSSPPDTVHRTTPTPQYYEQDNGSLTGTTTKSLSFLPENPTKKQLHVYMPETTCSSMINFLT